MMEHMPDASEQPNEMDVETDSVIAEQPASASPAPVGNSHEDSGRSSNHQPSSVSMLFLMASILFLASWFVGPRLVEEYQYASAKGELRAEYENAVTILENQPLKQVSMASQLVAHKVKPSVVSIRTRKLDEDNEFGRSGWDPTANVMEGFGSGVIMSSDGYVVTNAHVIDNSEKIFVELHDRRTYMAIEVGRDVISDIAVLKIEVDGLIPAQWGDSEDLEVGSIVWAVGSPYRYEQTVTSGIISAKNRRGDPEGRVKNLLQTDAAVNPGNSGGPLVNADGNVVGINTSIFGKTFQGISFAVPSATARFVYEQILARGKVVRGFLGVTPYEVTHRHATRMNLPDLKGARLISVKPGSPADRAGLLRNDIVRAWNEKPIDSFNSLYRLAERSDPGSVVQVSLLRDGEPRSASITIGEAPEQPQSRYKIQIAE